ncbi:hypothetical protein, partial [Mesorhizobium sp. M7A.F.Ca.CA.004.12.1.1]|uniref:hypothetical protein n=1 Tax=Mesorhizobium sp. M7A.F.Ca.CA.004.12.1.1 TaxID=2496732 RepID=UPI0019D1A1D7
MSIGFDFVKSRLMSDSTAGRLDPNQPVLGGRGEHPKSLVPELFRHQTRTASRSLNGFGIWFGAALRHACVFVKVMRIRVWRLASSIRTAETIPAKSNKNEQSRRTSSIR